MHQQSEPKVPIPPTGVKIGLEMHQQLDTGKLFCRCPSELDDSHNIEFERLLRPVISELGGVDRAALLEARRGKQIKYFANTKNSCAVEWDEEPPHEPDKEAVKIAAQIVRMLNAKPVDEIQFMRKILIDGSAVSGFQRTALIATHGKVDGVDLSMISLEEDSSRPVEKKGFNVDRLGVPLIEVATAPSIKTGEEAKKVAKRLGALFRMAQVKRGLGTIRQDLNISIPEGARVEIKGVQDLNLIPRIVEFEVERQKSIARLAGKLNKKFTRVVDVTRLFSKTESRIFKGTRVFVSSVKGAAGLFAEKLHDGKHLGREIAEYVKSFGCGGFVHSDERASPKEMGAVRRKIGAGNSDLTLLAAGDPEVIELVKERMAQLSKGVSEDTRKANPDGSTSFLRPLPTGARMYPETDILPFSLPDASRLDLPEERLKRLKKIMPQELAKKLYASPDYALFERLGSESILGVIMTNYLPALRRKGIKVSERHIKEILRLYKQGKLAKDGVFDALGELASGGKIDVEEVSLDEVRAFVRELIIQKKSYILDSPDPVKGLMGVVMKKYRGKIPGKWISAIIREEIDSLK